MPAQAGGIYQPWSAHLGMRGRPFGGGCSAKILLAFSVHHLQSRGGVPDHATWLRPFRLWL